MGKKKFYAVARGRNPGIYTEWFGKNGAQAQVNGYADARYKGFATMEEARQFLAANGAEGSRKRPRNRPAASRREDRSKPVPVKDEKERIPVYTDGGAIGNPGPGGYGVVILGQDGRRELQGGFRMTTNNRMEMTAVIKALESLPPLEKILVTTDSRYVVDGITKGWAKRWRKKGWMRAPGQPAANADLWERLLELCEQRDVLFRWVKGHAGHQENERCDYLANSAARMGAEEDDRGYIES